MIKVPTTQTGYQRITSEWNQVIAQVFLRENSVFTITMGSDTNCNTPLKRNIRDAQTSTNAHSTSSPQPITLNDKDLKSLHKSKFKYNVITAESNK